MQRFIDSPDQVWSDRKDAAKWLGLADSQFLAECKRFPHLLPHSVFGNEFMWHWLDLVRYQMFRPPTAPPEGAEK